MFKFQPKRSLYSEGFEPAGPPVKADVDEIAPVGQLFRGKIQDLTYLGTTLLVATPSGVDIIDAQGERTCGWLKGQYVAQVETYQDQVLLSVYDEETKLLSLYLTSPGKDLGEALVSTALPANNRFAVHPSGFLLMPLEEGATLFEIEGGTMKVKHQVELPSRASMEARVCGLSPNGEHFLVVGEEHLGLWCVAKGEAVERGWLAQLKTTASWTFLPDGRLAWKSSEGIKACGLMEEGPIEDLTSHEYAPFAGEEEVLFLDRRGGFQRLDADLKLQEELAPADEHESERAVLRVALARDRFAVYMSTPGELRLYGATTRVFYDYLSSLTSLSLSHDGQKLAGISSCPQGMVLLDRANGHLGKVCFKPGQERALSVLALNPDGDTLYFSFEGKGKRGAEVSTLPFEGGEVSRALHANKKVEAIHFFFGSLGVSSSFLQESWTSGPQRSSGRW